jgi:hypothetical protein
LAPRRQAPRRSARTRHRLPQVGLAQVGAEQVGPLQPRTDQAAAVEDRGGEIGVGEVAERQVQARQIHEAQRSPLAALLARDEFLVRRHDHVELGLAKAPPSRNALRRAHVLRFSPEKPLGHAEKYRRSTSEALRPRRFAATFAKI